MSGLGETGSKVVGQRHADVVLAMCPNPAWDVTYRVDELRPGDSHRVDLLGSRGGGKAINVARILREFGVGAIVCGPAGGVVGADIEADLAAAGIPSKMTPIPGRSRQSVAVVDSSGATVLNERGPTIDAKSQLALIGDYSALLTRAIAVVIAGSLPPGFDPRKCADLVELATSRNIPTIIDISGTALIAALTGRPTVVKINAAEAAATLGSAVDTVSRATEAAVELTRAGAEFVVISLGAAGMVAHGHGQSWRAQAPAVTSGNPTGAGDAVTAALLIRYLADRSLPGMLADGALLGAAAAATPVAGAIDWDIVHQRARRVSVQRLSTSGAARIADSPTR